MPITHCGDLMVMSILLMKRFVTSMLQGLGSALLLALPFVAQAEYGYNLPVGVTPVSHQIYDLHMLIFYICLAIGAGVFAALFYAIYAFRKSRGAVAANYHESFWIEILWTAIPLLLVVVMLIPAVRLLTKMDDTSKPVMNIKITGAQWKWQYSYLEEGIQFFSNLSTSPAQIRGQQPKGKHYLLEVDKPMVVPIHQKIRLLFTSSDVNHSWWVPDLGVKMDCIPGYVNEAWIWIEKPGMYRGQCTELCGMQHGYMPIVVDARSEADYEQWVRQQQSQTR